MNKSHLAKIILCAILLIQGRSIASDFVLKSPNYFDIKKNLIEKNKFFLAKANHSEFDALLKNYVSDDGKVNYNGFKKDKAALESYLYHLELNPPNETYTTDESLAYWINLYNASTIYLIVKKFPIRSIIEINQREPWSYNFVKSGDEIYTLNQIEHQIIRPKFKDPRIHFALNCAAKSCPRLLNRAYQGENLNEQLQEMTSSFINNSEKNTISPTIVQLSKLFEWYHDDFGNLHDFINKYAETKIASDANITYKAYDWSLNM